MVQAPSRHVWDPAISAATIIAATGGAFFALVMERTIVFFGLPVLVYAAVAAGTVLAAGEFKRWRPLLRSVLVPALAVLAGYLLYLAAISYAGRPLWLFVVAGGEGPIHPAGDDAPTIIALVATLAFLIVYAIMLLVSVSLRPILARIDQPTTRLGVALAAGLLGLPVLLVCLL